MKVNKVVILLLLTLFIGFWAGYGLRMHHETKILTYWSTEAERDLGKLEEEFWQAWIQKRTFFIFNHQYEIRPSKEKQVFYYKPVIIDNLKDGDLLIRYPVAYVVRKKK